MDQWVFLYIFSDISGNKHGFGAFAPGVGAEYFEDSTSGAYDMSTYEGSYKMRIGSKYNNEEPVTNLRVLQIYKGVAIHSSSADSIDDVLNSKLVMIRHRLSAIDRDHYPRMH